MNPITIIQLIILISGTLFLVYISRKALFNLKAHGFYRFFVFESCLLLVLLNIPYWFIKPLSAMQIISWAALIISLYLLYQSITFLKKIGGSKDRGTESANYKFENTVNVVKEGIYKYIRHPMYGSLLFLALGAFFKNASVYSIILVITAIIFLILTAKTEEKENINFFGTPYTDYIKETKMFIPFIF
jgi:protein-S-isoprenylcysteine O-methyltransferase Ste14